MDALAPFRLPAAVLKADEASYEWKLGTPFLSLFDEGHEGIDGQFLVNLELHREGGIINVDIIIEGYVDTICDRCSVAIKMPIEADYQMIINFGDPGNSTDEVIFVDSDSQELNVGKHIYDFILLSVPISHRVPGCESLEIPPCDMSILSYLSTNQVDDLTQGDEKSPWDDLKKVIDN